MVKAIMHGCNGRMGTIISDLCEKDDDIIIVAGVDPTGKGRFSYPVFYSISECDVEAVVVIDFPMRQQCRSFWHIVQKKRCHVYFVRRVLARN